MPTHTVDLLERLEIEWDSDSDTDAKENQNKSRHTTIIELRLECYMQSTVARGGPPAPVDPLAMPWAVIPPMFIEFEDENSLDWRL
ncbi:hypothetical protein BJ912DRAFT_994799, partial [Pholiota molesta]